MSKDEKQKNNLDAEAIVIIVPIATLTLHYDSYLYSQNLQPLGHDE